MLPVHELYFFCNFWQVFNSKLIDNTWTISNWYVHVEAVNTACWQLNPAETQLLDKSIGLWLTNAMAISMLGIVFAGEQADESMNRENILQMTLMRDNLRIWLRTSTATKTFARIR